MRLVADNNWTYIESGKHTTLDPVLAYYQQGYYFSPAYKKKLWDGKIRFTRYDHSRSRYRFATGLLPLVIDHLESLNWRYSIEDNRTFDYVEPNHTVFDNNLGEITLRDYQQMCVDAALTHGRGILKVATGGGKTVIGASIFRSIDERSVWFTHRTNLLYQTRDVLSERLRVPIGIVGDSECDLQQFTVSMVQTASNAIKKGTHPEFRSWLKDCRVLISDEAHHLESDQQQAVVEYTPADWRIGLTATPHLVGPGLALMALCGPIIANVPASYLIENGFLVRPDIWFVKVSADANIPKDATSRQAYKIGVVENDERNQRVGELMRIFRMEGRSVLILCDQLNHAKRILKELQKFKIQAGYINGKVSKADRDQQLLDLESGDLDCIVAITETMGEGTDIPFLDVVINATGTSGGGNAQDGESGRRTQQILGRILRIKEGKTRADYVDFMDTCHKSLKEATLSRIETLESEGYAPYIKFWTEYVTA